MIVELWDGKEGFDEFLEKRLAPATRELGIERETATTVTPLHNLSAPRFEEIPASCPPCQGRRVPARAWRVAEPCVRRPTAEERRADIRP